MITIHEDLKTDQLMSHKRIRTFVLRSLKRGKVCPVMALGIFLPQNSNNLFEIIALNELKKPPFKDLDYTMVGLAGSKSEAIMLMYRIWVERRK